MALILAYFAPRGSASGHSVWLEVLLLILVLASHDTCRKIAFEMRIGKERKIENWDVHVQQRRKNIMLPV